MKRKNIIEENECTGCGACYNICPTKSISMKKNEQGFLYPCIDEIKCIDCNKCKSVCPKIHMNVSNWETPKCYAAHSIDSVREKSSSGGIFSIVAKWIFKQNGIVCGAAFDDNFRVYHRCIDTIEELDKLRKSKYVQSELGDVFKVIENILTQDRWVLFVGTPCQVAGLNNYISMKNVNNNKLLLMDLICAGVPSPQMWEDYLKENFEMDLIDQIDFRPKYDGWDNCTSIFFSFKDGTSKSIPITKSSYEIGFHKSLTKRKCCQYCEFGGFQRQGDISIGDYWGINKYDASLNDGKGLNVIYINNEKGDRIFKIIEEELQLVVGTPLNASRFNSVVVSRKNHPMKERFDELYKNKNFTESVNQCIKNEHDIVILGNVAGMNYGSHLTHYALYSALTDMGYSVAVLNVPKDAKIKSNDEPVLFYKNPYPKWDWCKHYNSKIEMKELNEHCKAFITGSDQQFASWLYNNDGKFITQPFVHSNKRKIAYAASLGHDVVLSPETERATISFFLKRFDAISVREDTAVSLFDREFGVQSTHVLDPVFLMGKKRYENLIANSDKKAPNVPYLFTYILDPSIQKEKIIRKYAEQHNINVYAISDNGNSVEWSIPTIIKPKLETWITYFAQSDFVITDSFHGMCLAIIFHKQFFAIVNKKRGATRFESILRVLNLEKYAVYSEEDMNKLLANWTNIDYEKVDQILDRERKRSEKWLINAIEGDKKKKSLDTFDILDARIDELQDCVNNNIKNIINNYILPLANLCNCNEIIIKEIYDINSYLLFLINNIEKFTIFISVKDTPGYDMDNSIQNYLYRLGIKSNLIDKHWNSFLCIIHKGQNIIERIGEVNEKLVENIKIQNQDVHIESMGYKAGNKSVISIDKVDYSVNKRGFNFVIWDNDKNQVIDSIELIKLLNL